MLESLKGYLPGFVGGLAMKFFGGTFVALGYTQDSGAELIGGIVAFILGVIIDVVQHKKALNAPPPSA